MRAPPTRSEVFPLHLHTKYSILDGADDISAYIEYSKARGIPACACTDHGYVMGLYDLIRKCEKAEVKPIPGCEVYLHPGEDYVFNVKPYNFFHLTLWAMNQQGYRDLMALCSRAWLQGRPVMGWGKAKPRVVWEDLEMFGSNLICGAGCIEGPINKALRNNETDMATKNFWRLNGIFGDRLYMELMPSRVSTDFSNDPLIQVEGEDGFTYTFHPDDVISVDGGQMTARDAMMRGVTSIDHAEPRRAQPREITPTGLATVEGAVLNMAHEEFQTEPADTSDTGLALPMGPQIPEYEEPPDES